MPILRNLIPFFLLIPFFCFSNNENKLDSLLTALNTADQQRQTIILNQLSELYAKGENYPKAVYYKLKEKKLYQLQQNDSLISKSNVKLGLWYFYVGNYNESIKYLLQALEYYENKQDSTSIAVVSTYLANVNTRLENYSNAIKYILKSKQIFGSKKYYNKQSLIGVYINLGLAYADYGKLDSAMVYYNKALLLVDKNNKLYLATIKNNMGEVLYATKNYNEALENYEEAYKLFNSINFAKGKGAALANIAKVKIALGDYDEAIALSKEALIILKKIKALYFIESTQQQLYKAYKSKKQYDKALEALETYLIYKDSLKGAETKEYVANLEMQYEIKKEQQKIKILEQEHKLNRVKLYLTIAVVTGLLLITILIAVYFRVSLQKNKLKQIVLEQEQDKLEQDLAFKQRELENFANYIKEKNQLLEKLKNDIKTEGAKDLPKEMLIKNITRIINNNLQIDNDRKQLELKIDLEHQEFVNRLIEKHPRLTKNDIRLCSLILLELTNKEIATILNIAPSSVKMSKNRLRKKLNLPKGTDLLFYLKTI